MVLGTPSLRSQACSAIDWCTHHEGASRTPQPIRAGLGALQVLALREVN